MKPHHLWLGSCAFVLGVFSAGSALAVGNLQIETTGANVGQTTLVLEDAGGKSIPQARDTTATAPGWRDLNAGSYRLRTLVNGKPVGAPQTVQVKDGETARYRVNTQTGVATAVAAALLARPQQQQSMFWFGFGLGYADGKPSTTITSPFGIGAGDFNANGFQGGLEFQVAPPRLAQPRFLPFGYLRLYGLDMSGSGMLADFHPLAGVRDSGVTNKFQGQASLGAGVRFAATPEFGIGVLGGMAMTRMKTTVFSNETGGGGPYNEASSTSNSFGPQVGLELSYLLRLPQGRRTELFARWDHTWYGSNDAVVRSPFTGAIYTGTVGSGGYNQFTAGGRVNF